MILDIVVTNTDDGSNAEIPSLHGCETWAPDEDTALLNIISLAGYYLKIEPAKLKVDRARKEGKSIIYKLIFNK